MVVRPHPFQQFLRMIRVKEDARRGFVLPVPSVLATTPFLDLSQSLLVAMASETPSYGEFLVIVSAPKPPPQSPQLAHDELRVEALKCVDGEAPCVRVVVLEKAKQQRDGLRS
jgi:hypothetical protein